MKKFIYLFVVLGLIIAACGGSNDNDSEEETRETTTKEKGLASEDDLKVDKGKEIYKQVCIVCHGPNGDLQATGAVDLTKSALTLEEQIDVIANGRNTMAAYKASYSEEEIKALAEYTMKFKED